MMSNMDADEIVHRYSKPWKDSDVVLVLQEDDSSARENFYCHSTILALHSPVFECMFNNKNFTEGKERTATLIGKTREPFILFLDFMYPVEKGSSKPILGKRKSSGEDTQERSARVKRVRHSNRQEITSDGKSSLPTSENACEDGREILLLLNKVLEYADEYLVESVRLQVDQLLSIEVHNRILSVESKRDFQKCLQILLLADTYKLDLSKSACLSYISTVQSNLLYEDTCAKKLTPETQSILLKIEVNKLEINGKMKKKRDRDPNSPLLIELSDTTQRNLTYLAESRDSEFYYTSPNESHILNIFG